MSVCVRMAIYKKFERTETKVHVHFKFAHSHAKAFPCAMDPYLLNVTHATEDFSPCNSTPINLPGETDCAWSEKKGLQLDCSIGTKDNRSEGDQQTELRHARLDRRHVHGEKSSVTFSRPIGIELDSEGSIMSTCTEH